MAKLGILVKSEDHLAELIQLTQAARSQGHEVVIFFTHKGLLLTQDPRFSELTGEAEMSLCRVSYEANDLRGKPAPGLLQSGFATQARNAMMIEDCDRYVVF